MHKVKNWNDFNLNEGLFDFFRGKKLNLQLKLLSTRIANQISNKPVRSKDSLSWSWSQSIYDTYLVNLELSLGLSDGLLSFGYSVDGRSDLSFKTKLDLSKISLYNWKFNFRGSGLDSLVESVFKEIYPLDEIKAVFIDLEDVLDIDINFIFNFIYHGNDLNPSKSRCVWEIRFELLKSVYNSNEYKEIFGDICSQLNNMGFCLEEVVDYGDEESEESEEDEGYYDGGYDEEETEEDEEGAYDGDRTIYFTYHCYPFNFVPPVKAKPW